MLFHTYNSQWVSKVKLSDVSLDFVSVSLGFANVSLDFVGTSLDFANVSLNFCFILDIDYDFVTFMSKAT